VIEIIEIDAAICVGCAYCKLVCPVEGFKVEGRSYFQNRCNRCGRCVYNCPVEAIKAVWEE
jgi:ferredoxin